MRPLLALAIWAACGHSNPDGGPPGATPDAPPGHDGATGDGSSGSDGATPGGMLGAPSAATVADAIAATLTTYHRNTSTGDIWCAGCDGAPVVLAVAAYTGDTSVDDRLLAQIRATIQGGDEPFATGGYSANDERNVTAMYALAKRTPRIWSQLTADEVHLIDLVMEATLVADVYATNDATNGSGPPRTFEGSTNSDRDWNPNYREGMIGAVLVGTEYFGGAAATTALLASYDHAAFTAELHARGLANAYWTFDTYAASSGAGAPSPAIVQQGLQSYQLYGMTLDHLLDIYVNLAEDTFSATVRCGRIVSGCAGLPSVGMVGMEKEFDSVDAEGARDDAGYARLGTRANLFNQVVLVAYGDWQDTAESTKALGQVAIGVTDFFYKATQGYDSYSHGTDQGVFRCGADMDCTANDALWTEVLAPAHGL